MNRPDHPAGLDEGGIEAAALEVVNRQRNEHDLSGPAGATYSVAHDLCDGTGWLMVRNFERAATSSEVPGG